MANTFYNQIIRKMVVGFGNIFNDITLVRYNPDQTEAERMIVPIAYAPKELYVKRLEEDPTLGKKVMMTLPRLSFELTGFAYDASRKQNTNIKAFNQTSSGLVSQYNPVPYNFDFALYLYVRNISDGTQIIEHILSYFTPDYTIKLNLIPEMGIVKEIPVILNSTEQDIDYEGDSERGTRNIIWTLNFTVKGYIFGKVSESGVIEEAITNINQMITPDDVVEFNMNPTGGFGTYQIGEIVYQGYAPEFATATAKVIYWNNNKLHLRNINGNFTTSQPIYGTSTNANYVFTSYNLGGAIPHKYVDITVTPNPANANAASNWSANTTIVEYP
jgi:hypothetical protein